MNFRRRQRLTIWPKELSYFQIRDFDVLIDMDESNNVISEFIKSKYYHWQEQRIDNVPWTINNEKKNVDYNFHGIYDIKLLSVNDYQLVTSKDFGKFFTDSIIKEIGNDEMQPEINQCLNSFKACKYYVLRADDSKRHPFTVFEYFYSGLVLNEEKKIISVVEFGLD